MRLNHRSAPLRFVGGVVGGWIALRLALVLPWREGAPVPAGRPARAAPLRIAANAVPVPVAQPDTAGHGTADPRSAPPPRGAAAGRPPRRARVPAAPPPPAASGGEPGIARTVRPDGPLPEPPLPPVQTPREPRRGGRWSGSAWAYLREGSGAPALAAGGGLGGSQAGVRIAYRLAPGLSAAARLSGAIGQKGREIAAGIALAPVARSPLRLVLERRVALDRSGRSAFSAYAAGGFWRERGGIVADGYAQAGAVGLAHPDLFADGALRLGARIGRRAIAGAGLWGAAQPGIARLDLGPRAAVRLAGPLTLGVERRFRVAGRARPGSGLALTIAADF